MQKALEPLDLVVKKRPAEYKGSCEAEAQERDGERV